MDRAVTFIGAIGRTLDVMQPGQFAMTGLGKLAEAVLGKNTLVDGFTCTPTTPGSLSVLISDGQIFQQSPLESTALSVLPVDTHVITKQGLILDPTTLTLTPPNTIGQAVNVLIQAQYQDADVDPKVLNYYNAQDPLNPLRGPGGNGQQQPTVRRGAVALSPKYGVPNTSGSQTTPSPDAGWVGLHVVTIAYGQTAISAGNIVRFSGIPLIGAKLGEIPQAVQSNTWNYANDTGTTGLNIVAQLFPVPLSVGDGFRVSVKLARDLQPGATLNVNGTIGTVVRPGGGPTGPGDFRAGDILDAVRNGTQWIVISVGTSLATIEAPITRTVYGANPDFPDLTTAFAWLSRREILPTGSVSLQLPAGTGVSKVVQTTPVVFSHKNGERVFILGAPLNAPIPNPGLLTFTGNTQSARASDTAANLTALRAAYGTEILFTNGSSFRVVGKVGNVQDLLLTSDQTGGGDLLRCEGGTQVLTRVSCVNAAGSGIGMLFNSAEMRGTCHLLGAGSVGLSISDNGACKMAAGSAMSASSNGYCGIQASGGAIFSCQDVSASGPAIYTDRNGTCGVDSNAGLVILAASGRAVSNGQYGYFGSNPGYLRVAGCLIDGHSIGCYALFFMFINAANTSGTSTTFAFRADNAAQIYRIGTTASGATSPTAGSTGNNNATMI